MLLSIIIPCYNEKNTIEEILTRIEQVNFPQDISKEIIIVDDGSTDGTKEILEKLEKKYQVVFHKHNQGKGAAIRTGLRYVNGDYVIIQDADLEYKPNDYLRLLHCALKNKAQVVYGSRNLNKENQYSGPCYYLGGLFLSWLARTLYGLKITDEPTCYKLFKTETIKSIPLRCQGFEFCPEVTAKVAKRKIKIYEVAISYSPRSKKQGKKIKWKDGLEAIWTLIKYKFTD